MNRYKKELIRLKKQAEDAAGAVLRDDKVAGLRNQITWFKNEITNLNEVIEKQTREMAKYETRDSRITDDRKFLKE